MNVVGEPKTSLDTPALLVDVATLDANIGRIARTCADNGIRWRPHTKGQKTAEIVARELAAGARGITCAKLSEAEALAALGFGDFLVANQIVGPAKIERLMRLLRRTQVMVAVDNSENAQMLGAMARSHGVVAPVVIEVDIGITRAGVLPGEDAARLARALDAIPGLRFAGVMGWEGHAADIAAPDEKRMAVAKAVGALVASAERIRQAGIGVEIVSCGGTGTYPITAALPGVTEVQAGGGVFSDICYRKHYNIDHPYALTVLTTVTSRPNTRRVVCDAGKKSMSSDTATPMPLGLDGVVDVRLSAEHAIVELERDDVDIAVGDKLEFVVGYSDTTVHLHEEMYAVVEGHVAEVWSIIGRGKVR